MSESCTLSLQIRLLFSNRLVVIPSLSCPILQGTDFMIPADVHMGAAAGRVRLGENCVLAPQLSDEEFRDTRERVMMK